MARDAVIVSTARTPIGQAYRGAFNATPVADARRASDPRRRSSAPEIDAGEIDDVVMGAALQQGVQATHRPHRRASRRLPGHRRRACRSTANARRA